MNFSDDYQKKLAILWEKYIEESEPMPEKSHEVRPIIYESWKRAKAHNISPLEVKDAKLSEEELNKALVHKENLISVAHSYILNLYSFVKGSNFIIALTDERGYVIDLVGQDAMIQARAKKSGLTIGCNRSEQYAGTNGIGTCLYTGHPIQIWGYEHYIKPHHNYVCTAAPIKNQYGTIIGCLDIVGPMEAISMHTLAMVCAAVDGIEKEMKMRQAYEKIFVMNSQLVSTIQSISSGILMVDNMGIITHHNHRASNILKLPFDHLSYKNIADIVDIKSGTLNPLEITKNINNKEVTITNVYGIRLNLSLSASIIYNDAHEKISTVFIIDELQRIHKMITKMSGFTAKYTFESIVGTSSGINKLKALGLVAAQSDSNVLILGESGTGKELLAQSIHNASSRCNGPFIAINCGSLPKGLIESELFGYEGGAFTGANKDGYPGKFELAQGGTLFLDEIGDMPLEMQASLLRVIQTREIVRIGGKTSKPIDVRIMAATNVNLLESVKNKGFRSDLYYRLNVLSFVVPPLRERREDIPILADFFIRSYNRSMGKSNQGLAPEAQELMLSYDWPGNVRELENVIERAMNLTQEAFITESELTHEILLHNNVTVLKPQVQKEKAMPSPSKLLPKTREYDMIIDALEREDGNINKASTLLGIPKRTLYRKISKYQIDLSQYRVW
ncbi:sigma-54-dependent Fis family transcriptional regulator [Sinanaerobacter chloroacetimidivorans]|uniref:Sigma 54-interacting transcriptional regulator n=1 Tax=Sinanaerobacter chloroacetimidivorans TaxID=2818044 RepID=A0A8J8B2Z0_9FIRM|nr:sigma 54-interacting transcriptional regulator [Sinanaerobacter chloroacetimidivorans]MBR0599231.1 sigma 54-interacting transcriptional regulator [Sinanaerobacter chloroacetimidivorans]